MSRGFRGRYRVGPTPRERPGRSQRPPSKIMTTPSASVSSDNLHPIRSIEAADRPLLSGAPLDFAEAVAKVLREQENRIARLESLATQANSRDHANTGFLTVRAYARIIGRRLDLHATKALGKRAEKLCRVFGIRTGSAWDELFGEVRSYPVEVLEEAFAEGRHEVINPCPHPLA